ncbi:MAG: glycosyltransferase family 4 protein [Bdellovibrionales bacterium]|nr:glycosyltransferase family 4 protein [Bdellovibrionales bacterium]
MSFFSQKPNLPQQLNICIIANKFPIVGRAVRHGFLWPLARGLVQAGHKVTVLSWTNPRGKKEIEKDGVVAYFLGEGGYRNIDDFPQRLDEKFAALHAQSPFHLVHCLDRSGLIIAKKKKEYGVGVIFDVDATQMSSLFAITGKVQDTIPSQLKTALAIVYKFLTTYYGSDRSIINTADSIFVNNPQQQLILERYYLYPELKTYIIPYGIEIGDLSKREKSDELREKLGLPVNSHIVVTISDMNDFDESRNILRAFEKVAIKKPTARLLVLGNGPFKKDVEYETLQLALGSRVFFIGDVNNEEISDYISLAEVFVNLSSRTTGFEPSLLEAMAQKKIIIGSEVSPIANIVEDSKDGFLIRPADRKALSDLLINIFAEHYTLDQIKESARQKVLDIFNIDKMIQQTLSAYKETLMNRRLFKKMKLSEQAKPNFQTNV